MKKKYLIKVWPLMKDAKFGKMSNTGKGKFIRMIATLSLVVKDYESYREAASDKLMSGHKDFKDKLSAAQQYEAYKRGWSSLKPEMTDDEYKEFMIVYEEYNKNLGSALQPENDKDVKVKYEKLNTVEFINFCDSNDFTGEQALDLSVVMSSVD